MSLARTAVMKLAWVLISVIALALLLATIDVAKRELQQHQQQLTALREVQTGLSSIAREEADRAMRRVQELRGKPADVLKSRINEIDGKLAQHGGRHALETMPVQEVVLMAVRGEFLDQIRLQLQMELWRQEQKYLHELLQVVNYQAALEQLKELEGKRDAAYKVRQAADARFGDAQAKVNVAERAVSVIYKTRDVVQLEEARNLRDSATRNHSDLYTRTEQFRASLATHPGRNGIGAFIPALDTKRAALGQVLASTSAAIQDKLDSNWLHRIASSMWPHVVAATQLIFLTVGLYITWKVIFFFVVAPWVSRRPPICIERTAAPAQSTGEGAISSVSLRMTIPPGEEMLVKDAYLQDSPLGAQGNTRFLLAPEYPVASFASGMVGLTRIAAEGSAPVVTVSSTVDPLDELASIPLSLDSGFVLLPRYLLGVVQHPRHPITIKSVWRLGSLQAWLTWQLRYLVFYGPGTVIVRGCRGVRVERVDTQRRIAQAATIGFSASLDYFNGRTETFVPYLLGDKPLFLDGFGGQGWYAYQEVPASRVRSGFEGRVMGLFDVILKPLGI